MKKFCLFILNASVHYNIIMLSNMIRFLTGIDELVSTFSDPNCSNRISAINVSYLDRFDPLSFEIGR